MQAPGQTNNPYTLHDSENWGGGELIGQRSPHNGHPNIIMRPSAPDVDATHTMHPMYRSRRKPDPEKRKQNIAKSGETAIAT